MQIDGNTSDKILLENIGSGGGISSFRIIFKRYYPSLCAYARLWIKDDAEIENIVQDLMLWLWENRKNLSITTSLSSYLFTSVRNRCLKLIARDRVQQKVLENICSIAEEETDSYGFFEWKELRNRIEEAVSAMPVPWQTVFRMNRFDHLTYKEIASKLGISAKTVDYRMCRSLDFLRKRLKEYLPVKDSD